MALVNKINFVLRSTYPHYHCILTTTARTKAYVPITISQLLFDRFYNQDKKAFVCPDCHRAVCTPECSKDKLLRQIEQEADEQEAMIAKIRQLAGAIGEKRSAARVGVDIGAVLEQWPIRLVDMSDTSIGFLCDGTLNMEAVKEIRYTQLGTEVCVPCRITRPSRASYDDTGFHFFYGAERVVT